MPPLYTIGYQGRSLEEFLAVLRREGIGCVVDVRRNALSRKPGFSKTALREALAGAGIDYLHLRRLGIERPSWAQGQPEYVEPVAEGDRLGCANCGKTLPEDYHQTVPRKFCSDLCRRAANNRRTAVLGVQRTWAEEVARRAAEAEAAKAKRERKCVVCGTAFQPHKATQEVCSRSCSNKLRPRGGRQRKG